MEIGSVGRQPAAALTIVQPKPAPVPAQRVSEERSESANERTREAGKGEIIDVTG